MRAHGLVVAGHTFHRKARSPVGRLRIMVREREVMNDKMTAIRLPAVKPNVATSTSVNDPKCRFADAESEHAFLLMVYYAIYKALLSSLSCQEDSNVCP